MRRRDFAMEYKKDGLRLIVVIAATIAALAVAVSTLGGCSSGKTVELKDWLKPDGGTDASTGRVMYLASTYGKEASVGNVTFDYPDTWVIDQGDDKGEAYLYMPSGGFVYIDARQDNVDWVPSTDDGAEEAFAPYFDGMEARNPGFEFSDPLIMYKDGTLMVMDAFHGDDVIGCAYVVSVEGSVFQIYYQAPEDQDSYEEVFAMIATVKVHL